MLQLHSNISMGEERFMRCTVPMIGSVRISEPELFKDAHDALRFTCLEYAQALSIAFACKCPRITSIFSEANLSQG